MTFEDWLLDERGLTAETLSKSEIANLYDEFRAEMRERREASSRYAAHRRAINT